MNSTAPHEGYHDATETDEQFRARLRAFLDEHRPGRRPRRAEDRLRWQKDWLATLFDAGFAGPSWPRRYGGMELGFARQVIYQEEYNRARVPGPLGTGLGIAAPTIIKYGTEEQKDRYLRPMLRGDSVWAQGYSEPGAGSDLPALRTTARRAGGGPDDVDAYYVVDGQKVWNSAADIADVLFTLVRTGPPGSRQDGISYLLIDAHSPGVTVRPLRDLTGDAHFCEIFFNEVRVPVANRIGAENGGWPLVRTSLGHERAAGAMNQAALYRRVLDELIELAHERGATADPLIRDRLAEFEMRVRIMRLTGMRTISDILAKGEPGPASSTSRLFIVTFEQELHEFAVDLLGCYGILDRHDPHAVQRGRWVWGFLRTRASTIGAGTAEIQRNTIAEQVLGLPRDPAMPSTGRS
ncbi:acyl-CoA dehydrogenase family protein [Nocardia macrotermitis]|uniref:Putative acyl-CoA dehydrogenase FadE17 n=1 Tax=Nocardia macrotermitis TaxID=2585198 RepID=A0A7K0D6U9_9NOCA|nr:acyl-CoA dehydrogenase family protein [Nocardia macrotermitis]MQY21485.1 putative acyl-CoA dehydrogenase FadE17 [Nocardia macrotermitis]